MDVLRVNYSGYLGQEDMYGDINVFKKVFTQLISRLELLPTSAPLVNIYIVLSDCRFVFHRVLSECTTKEENIQRFDNDTLPCLRLEIVRCKDENDNYSKGNMSHVVNIVKGMVTVGERIDAFHTNKDSEYFSVPNKHCRSISTRVNSFIDNRYCIFARCRIDTYKTMNNNDKSADYTSSIFTEAVKNNRQKAVVDTL